MADRAHSTPAVERGTTTHALISVIIAPAILFAVLAGIATPDPVASGHALRLEAVR